MKLDRNDARLLNALQRNARLTGDELAAIVHLSIAACNRRVARLRDSGIIEADVAIVSPERAGYALQLTVLLSLKMDRSPDSFERLKATFRKRPEIVNAVSVTGRWDFVLTVVVRSPQRYEELMAELRAEHPSLDGSEALLVVDRIKTGFEVLVEAQA